jgi:hypothetical protein
VLGSIVAHRLQPARGSSMERDAADAGAAILAAVPVP